MNLEEKIDYFHDEVASDADARLQKQLEQYEATLKRDYDQFVTQTDRTLDARYSNEAIAIKKANNKALADLQIRTQHDLFVKRSQLKKQVIDSLKQKLADYKQTDDYQMQLIQIGATIGHFAGDETYDLYLDPSDAALQDTLENALNHPIIISDRPFIGGLRGVLRERDVLLDYSFATYLDEWDQNWDIDQR